MAQPVNLQLLARIVGRERDDLVVALEEILRIIKDDKDFGIKSNDTSVFSFTIETVEHGEDHREVSRRTCDNCNRHDIDGINQECFCLDKLDEHDACCKHETTYPQDAKSGCPNFSEK